MAFIKKTKILNIKRIIIVVTYLEKISKNLMVLLIYGKNTEKKKVIRNVIIRALLRI